ncbi:hypothetical protein [Micromonospora chalcea]|uniref:hypothetical protein n=1 Tax=Micromonospora chalcea TaxID=1874 RepID=UPI0011B0C160|nr:hypothetical protein [Micromonospora chalcea]
MIFVSPIVQPDRSARKKEDCMDLSELAQAGAATVVAAMTTDAWGQVRLRLARLLAGGDDQRQHEAAADLSQARERLIGLDDDERTAAGVEAELRGQLRERLRSDPNFAAEFAVLVEEIGRHIPAAAPSTINQRGVASRGGTVIQAGRDVNGIPPR